VRNIQADFLKLCSLVVLSIHTDSLLEAETLAKGVAFQGDHKKHLPEADIPSSFHSFEIQYLLVQVLEFLELPIKV